MTRAMQTDADVLVVGLGPAGSSAAAAATAAGCTVLALDHRAEIGAPVQCAEFVPAAFAHPALAAPGVTLQAIRRMVTVVEDGPPEESADFRGRMLSRHAFDQALLGRAVAAGAWCRCATHVAAIRPDGSVDLSDGRTVRGRVLIGADGPRSRVAAAIGQANVDLLATRQVSVPLAMPHDATDIFLSADFPGGYAWMFPRGDLANVGAGVNHSHRALLRDLLAIFFRRLVARGIIRGNPCRLTGGLIPAGGRRRATGTLGRTLVALAGDAAGLTNPVTGAGIEAAVVSGALAGAAAAAWINGDTSAIADYEEELAERYDVSLNRACARRRELATACPAGRPDAAALRRAWVAFPEYWGADLSRAASRAP
jgi:geranylgeranyl reductase family protein